MQDLTSASARLLITVTALLCVLRPAFAGAPADPAAEAEIEAQRAELITLAAQLRAEHPQPFAYVSEQAFEALAGRLVSSVNARTSRRDMLWAFSELIASVGCGHTSLPFFNQEDALIEPAERLPVAVTVVGNKLFVVDPLSNADRLATGDEITAINGTPAATLIADVLRHISADNHNPAYRRAQFRVYATSYLTYALRFPERYRVRVAGRELPVELEPLTAFTPRPVIRSDDTCRDALCLEDLAPGIAKMTIRNWDFYGDRQSIFKSFIDESFASLAEQGTETLIIDVRGNLGGTGFATAYLLRHLATAPFRYFHPDSAGAAELKQPQGPIATDWAGRVIVLADAQTQSSTGHFLSHVKAHGLATIVGRASGAGATVNANAARYTSAHSGIAYGIARSRFYTDTPDHDVTTSIIPDVNVEPTAEAAVHEDDIILQQALSVLTRVGRTQPVRPGYICGNHMPTVAAKMPIVITSVSVDSVPANASRTPGDACRWQ